LPLNDDDLIVDTPTNTPPTHSDPEKINVLSVDLIRLDPKRLQITMKSDVLEQWMLQHATKDGTVQYFDQPAKIKAMDWPKAYKGDVPDQLRTCLSYGHDWGNIVLYPADYASELLKLEGINKDGVTIVFPYPGSGKWTPSAMRSFAAQLQSCAETLYRDLIMEQTVTVRVTAVNQHSQTY
jgi:hypothetical protein